MRRILFAAFILSMSTTIAAAQEAAVRCAEQLLVRTGPVAGPEREAKRTVEIAGALPLGSVHRRESTPAWEFMCGDSVRGAVRAWLTPATSSSVALLPVRLASTLNSAFADDRNNGVMWSGRGLSTALSGGVELRVGPVSAAFNPVLTYSANADFATTTQPNALYDSLTQLRRRLDWPERFGRDGFAQFDLGQSYVRVDGFGVGLGASTENVWWSPGIRNSIVLGSSAPGFPHVFLGSSKPINTPIGRIDFEALWGQVGESEYFDTVPGNGDRLYAGLTVTYEPRWLPGLQLGLNRAFMHMPDSVSTAEFIFGIFQPPLKSQLATPDNPQGLSPDDQIASLFARWVLPAAQFEAYVEWAKADHNADWWDLLNQPDHAQAYTLGIQKIVPGVNRWLRVQAEMTHLNAGTTSRSGRGGGNVVAYYVHSRIAQGYTNEGQLLGAWIGPGSNTQFIAADLMGGHTSWGAYVERIAHDNDAYYAHPFVNTYRRHGHDAEFGVGARGSFSLKGIVAGWRGGWNIRRNRDFLGLDGTNFDYLTENNWSFELNAMARVEQWLRK
jgi:hypothetical protein